MTSVLTAILAVFSSIGTWIVGAVQDMIPIFWNSTDSSLTLIGVLSVAGLGLSVIFLVVGLIQRFFHFAG